MAEPALHPELVNLAAELDDEELDAIAQTVIEEYKADEESRADWLTLHAQWMRLFFQKDIPVNQPWPGSSTESMPLLTEACIQFHARAYKAFFPNRNIIKALPTGKTDRFSEERAKRVSTHMSCQLLTQDRTYKRSKDRLLLAVPLHGQHFTKTYYDPNYGRNVTKNVRAMDLVVPYGTGPRDIGDIERKTEVIWMSVNESKILEKNGYFVAAAEAWEGEQADTETQKVANQAEGVQPTPQSVDKTVAKILEQHRLLDLDGDGIAEPYIVTVDAQAEKTLRVSIRYEVDGMGRPVEGKKPIEYYTSWAFLENPDGFYGLGMGHLIGGINASVNKLLRQTIDAGTLANIGNMSGFISKQLSAKKGEIELQLGKFMALENSGEDINRGIFQFKFPGPSNVLPALTEELVKRSDRLATVTEALTGQMETVQQPTTVLALIDQGLEVFSSIYERLFTSWEDELNKIYTLNGKYLNEQEYYALLDVDGTIQNPQAPIGRADYAPDMQVAPLVDPKMATEKKKVAKAQAEYQVATTNPLIAQNPVTLYAATRRYLEAMDVERIDEILPPMGPPPTPPRVDDPGLENFSVLQPVPSIPPVHDDQNHLEHIKSHEGLLHDPQYGQRIRPEGQKMLLDHIQNHVAFAYAVTETPYAQVMEPDRGRQAA